MTHELKDLLPGGVPLNEDGSFIVKAGVCNQALGIHYAGVGAEVDSSVWETSTSNTIYAHFWTTSAAGPAKLFDDRVA